MSQLLAILFALITYLPHLGWPQTAHQQFSWCCCCCWSWMHQSETNFISWHICQRMFNILALWLPHQLRYLNVTMQSFNSAQFWVIIKPLVVTLQKVSAPSDDLSMSPVEASGKMMTAGGCMQVQMSTISSWRMAQSKSILDGWIPHSYNLVHHLYSGDNNVYSLQWHRSCLTI